MSEIAQLITCRMYEKWQVRWDMSAKGRVTYQFIGNVSFAERTLAFDPDLLTCFVLTGHGRFNQFLYERKLSYNEMCAFGRNAETWIHFLAECDMYEFFRDLDGMRIQRECVSGWNVNGTLSSRESYNCFVRFIRRAFKMRKNVTNSLLNNAEVCDSASQEV